MDRSRTSTMAALAAGLFLQAARASAVTSGDVWNEVFSADEQRILYAIKADPQADAALKAGLRRVVSASPQALEAEKRRFQAEWLARIQTFSSSYHPGQGQGGVKPTVEQARTQLPWLAEIDQRDWGGQLLPTVSRKMDAYELGYNLAHLRSLNEEDRKAITDKLGMAKTFRYSADGVADEMVKAGRETMGQVLTGLNQELPARVATVRQQLEAAERLLASAPGGTAGAGNGGAVFDGSRPAPGSTSPVPAGGNGTPGSSVPPVPPGTQLAGPGGAVSPTTPSLTAPAPGSSLPGSGGLDNGDVPPPRTPAKGEKTYAAKAGGSGPGIGAILKSPVGMGGLAGGLFGAVAGFFLGGPLGALLGFALGAAAGAGLGYASGYLKPGGGKPAASQEAPAGAPAPAESTG